MKENENKIFFLLLEKDRFVKMIYLHVHSLKMMHVYTTPKWITVSARIAWKLYDLLYKYLDFFVQIALFHATAKRVEIQMDFTDETFENTNALDHQS